MHEQIWEYWTGVRSQAPLVHNITNYVVMNTVANALLALGASPVMAHAAEEIDDIVGIASALSVNIGTLSPSWVAVMQQAVDRANKRSLPIVLDPVGAGASRYRTVTSLALMRQAERLIVRGNASEIRALAGGKGTTRGVDSTESSAAALEAMYALAEEYACIVCVSGEEDIIVGGGHVYRIQGGSPLMPRVTGMGCTASAVVAAFAAICGSSALDMAAVAGMGVMATAGGNAARSAAGPGSFYVAFLDALFKAERTDLEREAIVTMDESASLVYK